jgi:hypothetical protein
MLVSAQPSSARFVRQGFIKRVFVLGHFVSLFLFCTAIYCKNAVLVETIHIPEPAFA